MGSEVHGQLGDFLNNSGRELFRFHSALSLPPPHIKKGAMKNLKFKFLTSDHSTSV
jgi:hypothetical protein